MMTMTKKRDKDPRARPRKLKLYEEEVEKLRRLYALRGKNEIVIEATDMGMVWHNHKDAYACERDLVDVSPEWSQGMTYTAIHALSGLPIVCIRRGDKPLKTMPSYWTNTVERPFLRPTSIGTYCILGWAALALAQLMTMLMFALFKT